jgi:Family of unknown function (DUF6262)
MRRAMVSIVSAYSRMASRAPSSPSRRCGDRLAADVESGGGTDDVAEGAPVSFQAVARLAGVSRQWLYTQPELVERLRGRAPARTDGVPARQRATEASLRQRVESLRTENQRLRAENQRLKDELALAYGQQRAAGSG